jgi:glycosyltransferase involved in cell wall biosynthesis
MRIAQLAPLAETVPPRRYGGTERIVSWLTEELVTLGEEVTLFASAGSVTRANLVPAWPHSIRHSRPRPDPCAPIAALLEAVAERASEFDVIHAHVDWVHLPLLRRLGIPFLTTLHGRLDTPHLSLATRGAERAPFVSISNSQRAPLPEADWLGTVYHGMPPNLLELHRGCEGYLAFLGRISPEKGPQIAIRLAKAAGLPLRIAAKVPRDGNRFFKSEIEPLLDGKAIEFIGEVNDRGKMELLGNARALLFPINWPEPFGLVMIEAMACGTPVIAWRRGSVPEIIDDGVTGFVVDNEPEAIEAISRVGDLDRDRIRATFERRFTSGRMAEDYLRLYRSLAAERSTGLTEPPAPRVAVG